MPLMFKQEKSYENNILSATRPSKTTLKTDLTPKTSYKTILRQKSIIKVYVDDDKYYIEHASAYALGIINTRAVMLDTPKLVEISLGLLNKLKADSDIEIEYIRIEKKQPIRVYVDGSNYCIDNSAAYSLGLLSVEEFNNADNDYYYINESLLNSLKEKYKIEFYSLSLEEFSSERKR